MSSPKHHLSVALACALWLGAQGPTQAATEALNWNTEGQRDITCIYGEITVLTSIPGIYFCGAQWGGVGGYCGIQHNSKTERRTIFSIWDTTPKLHPKVTEADSHTVFNRFGGEGEGAHTHMVLNWKHGETIQFFLRKQPGPTPGTTDTRFYLCDPTNKWRHLATINSPDGSRNRGKTFTEVCSWIENFAGVPMATPKIALYGLWIGASPDGMKHVTRTGGESGSGRWGQIQGTYFLAEGSQEQLDVAFATLAPKYGQPVYGTDGKELTPIPNRPLSPEFVQKLSNLPRAPGTKQP